MGHNYYWEEPGSEPCETCGHVEEHPRLHIGKSSAGWVFSLRVHPERKLNTLEDWKRFWRESKGQIRDEYGEHVNVEEMLKRITERTHPSGRLRKGPYDANCRPGEGTWDYCHYEFS